MSDSLRDFAEYDFGELAGAEFLADAFGPVEDVAVGDAATGEGLLQAVNGLVLPDDGRD